MRRHAALIVLAVLAVLALGAPAAAQPARPHLPEPSEPMTWDHGAVRVGAHATTVIMYTFQGYFVGAELRPTEHPVRLTARLTWGDISGEDESGRFVHGRAGVEARWCTRHAIACFVIGGAVGYANGRITPDDPDDGMREPLRLPTIGGHADLELGGGPLHGRLSIEAGLLGVGGTASVGFRF